MKPAGGNTCTGPGKDFEPVARQQPNAMSAGKQVCHDCAQRRFCLAHGLEANEAESLENLVTRSQCLGRNEQLYYAGEQQRHLYAVRSGLIKLSCNPGTGEEQVIGFRFPGDMFGLEALGGGQCTHSAVAVEASSVCQIPGAAFLKASRQSAQLQHHLYQLFARQIAIFNQARIMMGKGKAEAGLATFLLELSDRHKARGFSGTDFHLGMSRADIGSYLGIALETVSRLFSRFQLEGVLQVEKRYVVILDRERLESLADSVSPAGLQLRAMFSG